MSLFAIDQSLLDDFGVGPVLVWPETAERSALSMFDAAHIIAHAEHPQDAFREVACMRYLVALASKRGFET
jgi:hypothetical protein